MFEEKNDKLRENSVLSDEPPVSPNANYHLASWEPQTPLDPLPDQELMTFDCLPNIVELPPLAGFCYFPEPHHLTTLTFAPVSPSLKADSDPAATRLYKEAKTIYKVANERYRSEEDRVFPYILLDSARRTCEEQFQLYYKYMRHVVLGETSANRANKPGKSLHEYGLAIDVVRGDDGKLLKRVLNDAGWDRYGQW